MMVTEALLSRLEERGQQILSGLESEILRTLTDLVRIPSENFPPTGNEQACQLYVAGRLRELGIEPDVYEVSDVPELTAHPQYWPGRDYHNRPNVNGVLKGGSGPSLVLSGHIDTVPIDTPVPWSRAPFAGEQEDGRLYGRGAWDMKAGVAINLAVLRTIRESGLTLGGDLIFETVVDEEFGGSNGTLAGRLRGYNADAAIVTEPTKLHICPAQRGGRVVHLELNGRGGMLLTNNSPAGRVVDQLTYILARLPEFTKKRACRVTVDPYFANCPEPFAVWVTNIATGRWGWTQPLTVPERCRVELYWQTMPCETGEEVKHEFLEWWHSILSARPDLFAAPPEVVWPMRWIPGCSIPADSPLVVRLHQAAASLGVDAPVEGLDSPSDMYLFQDWFDTPAVMWGPDGANAHQPDEYVDIESVFKAA
ncbi:MAG: M20/M25/M40 family metallo-hydrolase, partial [Bryobacteraceae bacterium]